MRRLLILLFLLSVPLGALAQDVPDDFETFTSDDDRFTLAVPQDWTVEASDTELLVANRAALLEDDFDPDDLTDEDFVLTIILLPDEFLRLMDIDSETPDDLAQDFAAFLQTRDADDDATEIEVNQDFTLGRLVAYRDDEGVQVIVYAFALDDDLHSMAVLSTRASGDDLDALEDILYASFGTLAYTGDIDELLGDM